MRIILSVESFSTIPFQARTSYVNILEWGQHSSNRRTQCLISLFGTIQGTGDQPNENPDALYTCPADIFSNITSCDIQHPSLVIALIIGQMRLVRCPNHRHNCCSSRKLILCIRQPSTCVHFRVYSVIVPFCEAHQFEIEVRLKWDLCQKELYTFDNICVV